jgi:hypothetical protein
MVFAHDMLDNYTTATPLLRDMHAVSFAHAIYAMLLFNDTATKADQGCRSQAQARKDRSDCAATQSLALQCARYIAKLARAYNALKAHYFAIGNADSGLEAYLGDPVSAAQHVMLFASTRTDSDMPTVGRGRHEITEQGKYHSSRRRGHHST